MQIDQPIWFEWQGKKVYGVTTEVLPDKKGIIAKALVDGKEVMVKVPAPHKVRDPQEAAAVMKAFGYELVTQGANEDAPSTPQYKEPVKYNEDAKFVPFEELIKGNKFDAEFLSILQTNSAMKPKDPEPPKAA